MKLHDFQINQSALLKDALSLIDKNTKGVIFVTDNEQRVLGLATDGDIRRYLLKNGKLEDVVRNCMNEKFLWKKSDETRENLLKCLDDGTRIIPILDESHRLVNVITPDHFPLNLEQTYFARSRAPTRVSFGGGGSDLTHYFATKRGAVINATISIYAHATLKKRLDQKVMISSYDLNEYSTFSNIDEFLGSSDGFDLVRSVLRLVKPSFGFDLYLQSDFPIKSGLGGSASMTAAILGCFNEFRLDRWDHHEMAEIAFQAERLELSVSGGWQDQYASIFGGFNFIEFTSSENLVHPLRIRKDTSLELEESLILCHTGISHESGEIHKDQKVAMQEKVIAKLVERNVELCYHLKSTLLRGQLMEFGNLINQAWQLKRKLSNKISSAELDQIYDFGLKNGALGGKLLGAGGGGFFLFFVLPSKRNKLMAALRDKRLTVLPFKFDESGLVSWTVRDHF